MFHVKHDDDLTPIDERLNLVAWFDTPADSFFDWLNIGIERGWCSPVACATHDGLPNTRQEIAEYDAGECDDPCVHGVRIWGPDGHPDDQGDD
jgi:hypothetical protein